MKVGDRVRILAGVFQGEEGKIVDYIKRAECPWLVKLPDKKLGMLYTEKELEVIK